MYSGHAHLSATDIVIRYNASQPLIRYQCDHTRYLALTGVDKAHLFVEMATVRIVWEIDLRAIQCQEKMDEAMIRSDR